MTNELLIQKAASVIRATQKPLGSVGDVGCALLAENNTVYCGICADLGSNSFCAEKNAIASMITDGIFGIQKIVAVWKNDIGEIFVISPCGSCRQLIYDIDSNNLHTEVILDADKTVVLSDMLPYSNWWQKQ